MSENEKPVSPYLRRPLRSYEEFLRERSAPDGDRPATSSPAMADGAQRDAAERSD